VRMGQLPPSICTHWTGLAGLAGSGFSNTQPPGVGPGTTYRHVKNGAQRHLRVSESLLLNTWNTFKLWSGSTSHSPETSDPVRVCFHAEIILQISVQLARSMPLPLKSCIVAQFMNHYSYCHISSIQRIRRYILLFLLLFIVLYKEPLEMW